MTVNAITDTKKEEQGLRLLIFILPHFGIKETFDGNLLLNIFLFLLFLSNCRPSMRRVCNEFITLCNVAELRETSYRYRSDTFSTKEQWF